MKNIYETRFYDILTKITDLVIANLLFIIGSLPVITIGVSARALYCSILKLDNREHSVKCIFWSAYREKFWQMLACSAVFAVTAILLLADFIIVTQYWVSAFAQVCSGLIIAAGIVLFLTLEYFFSILAAHNIKIGDAIVNSFVLSMRYLPRSLAICILDVFPIALAYFWTYIMQVFLPVWICIGFALTAYVNVRLMRPAFNDIKNKDADFGEGYEQ